MSGSTVLTASDLGSSSGTEVYLVNVFELGKSSGDASQWDLPNNSGPWLGYFIGYSNSDTPAKEIYAIWGLYPQTCPDDMGADDLKAATQGQITKIHAALLHLTKSLPQTQADAVLRLLKE